MKLARRSVREAITVFYTSRLSCRVDVAVLSVDRRLTGHRSTDQQTTDCGTIHADPLIAVLG